MILTCPACETQYVVKDGAIAPRAAVRCATASIAGTRMAPAPNGRSAAEAVGRPKPPRLRRRAVGRGSVDRPEPADRRSRATARPIRAEPPAEPAAPTAERSEPPTAASDEAPPAPVEPLDDAPTPVDDEQPSRVRAEPPFRRAAQSLKLWTAAAALVLRCWSLAPIAAVSLLGPRPTGCRSAARLGAGAARPAAGVRRPTGPPAAGERQ